MHITTTQHLSEVQTTEVDYQSRVQTSQVTSSLSEGKMNYTSQTNEPQINLEPLKHQEQVEEQSGETSAVILPMSLIDYKAYKEREFLKTISNWQLGLYFALKYEPNCAEKMRKILNEDQYKKFEEARDNKALPRPSFLSDFEVERQDEFTKLVDSRNFEAIDAWMTTLPKYHNEYQEWIQQLKTIYPLLDIASLSKEKKAIIKNLTLEVGKEISANAPGSSDISDSSAFRDRQGSYCKKMNKEFLGGGLNHPDDKHSWISKLQIDGRVRNSQSDSCAYSQMENHTPELADDKQAILDKELAGLNSDPHCTSSPTEDYPKPNDDDRFDNLLMSGKDVNEEFEITVEYLQGLKEKAMESLPEETNILLLGESGVGKSTFLNAFANYLLYICPDDALQSGVQVLTPVNYVFYDDERNASYMCEGPNGVEYPLTDEKTIDPKIHTFVTKHVNGTDKIIRLLDTPGVGDEGGIDMDQLNFAKIMENLKEFTKINAICILLPANEARMSTMFRYCMNELLNQLDKSLKNNIFFCFTKSRTTMYRFGDTVPTLQKLLAESKVDIPVDMSTGFSFDNECVRYILGKKRGMFFEEGEEATYLQSWNKSSVSAFKLLEKVATTTPVKISNTLNMNEIRLFLERISSPLVKLLKVHIMNKQLIERKLRILGKTSSSYESNSVANKPMYTLKVLPLDRPQMVCTSEKCTRTVRVGNSAKTEYTICHMGCIVKEPSRKVPHPELQYCREIKDGYCQKCGCSWTHHMHMTEEYETTSRTMLPEYTSDKDEKNTLTKEKNLIQLEIDSILCSCAQFSSFIVANAMTGDQDVFRQAFDQMLREVSDVKTVVEKYMTSAIQYDGEHNVKNTKESELLRQLVEVKEAYIDKVSMNNAKNISLDTIERSVNDLQSLQSWKSVIEVVQEGLKKYNKDVIEKYSKETRDDRF